MVKGFFNQLADKLCSTQEYNVLLKDLSDQVSNFVYQNNLNAIIIFIIMVVVDLVLIIVKCVKKKKKTTAGNQVGGPAPEATPLEG